MYKGILIVVALFATAALFVYLVLHHNYDAAVGWSVALALCVTNIVSEHRISLMEKRFLSEFERELSSERGDADGKH